MKRIKKLFTYIHFFLWVAVLLFIGWKLLIGGRTFRPNFSIGIYLMGIYTFYANFLLLDTYFRVKKYKEYFLGIVGVLITAPFPLILFRYEQFITPLNQFLVTYSINMGAVVIFIVLSSAVKIIQNLILNTIRKQELEQQAIKSELDYLKFQINPHFLFNTLNNIHTLVYNNAPSAPDALMKLSSLMRYMIYEANSNVVPLTREIEYLRDYIALQQLRYKPNPIVDFKVVGDAEKFQIAPLLFIHLLENTYKHSPSDIKKHSITVMLELSGRSIKAIFTNQINLNSHKIKSTGGVGINNVIKRLKLLYPNQYSLDVDKSENIYKVELRINNIESTRNHDRKNQLLCY